MKMIDQNANTKQGLMFLAFFFLVVIVYGIWEFYIRKDVKQNGIYSKCYIKDVLGYKGGVRIDVDYSFRGKQYKSLINYSGNGVAKGEQYFIMLLPNEPSAITFENNPVPSCLLNTDAPFDGWQHIPTCDSH